jgi:hypothetical protein
MKNMQKWLKHFDENRKNRPEPDWTAPLEMSGRPLELLRRSIQQFQLGDGGGPAYLIAWNRDLYLSDPSVKRLVDLWFREEREHSRLLGGMLRRLGGEEIKNHWSFSLFCGVRKLLGVRFELSALLCTEIVSHVYYKMLRKHGSDPALRDMCNLIIRDETGHIAFHRSRLAEESAEHPGKYGVAWEWMLRMRAVMAGTVLWVNHRGALHSMGATDLEFYRWIWRDLSAFIRGLRRDCVATNEVNNTAAARVPAM